MSHCGRNPERRSLRCRRARACMCSRTSPGVCLQEAARQHRVPLGDQYRCITTGIETVSPAGCFVDGEGTLMIAAVKMAVCAHMRSRIERIAEFCLQDDLNRLALMCGDGQHASTLSISRAICRQHATSKLDEQMDHEGKVIPSATSTFPNGGHVVYQTSPHLVHPRFR